MMYISRIDAPVAIANVSIGSPQIDESNRPESAFGALRRVLVRLADRLATPADPEQLYPLIRFPF